jgi:hypothetical protein
MNKLSASFVAGLILGVAIQSSAIAGPPRIYSDDGKYLGNASSNTYDPESVNNPYGQYGNSYAPDSVKNPYGRYGSPYSPDSVNNPYATSDGPGASPTPPPGRGYIPSLYP